MIVGDIPGGLASSGVGGTSGSVYAFSRSLMDACGTHLSARSLGDVRQRNVETHGAQKCSFSLPVRMFWLVLTMLRTVWGLRLELGLV